MRSFINKIVALTAVAACMISCAKDDSTPSRYIDKALVGEWHLTAAVSEGCEIDTDTDIYMVLSQDGTFDLYQKGPDQLRYERFKGIWYCLDGIVMGEYSDGSDWGGSYIPKVSGNRLTFSSVDLMETQTYKKGSLSESEKQNAILITTAKSAPAVTSPIL